MGVLDYLQVSFIQICSISVTTVMNEGFSNYKGLNCNRQNGAFSLEKSRIQSCCQKLYLCGEDKMGVFISGF